MIMTPPILALLIFSALAAIMLLYACRYGVQILRRWDINSGSEFQLAMERRTYLISTIVNYVFAFQLLSFFFFIYAADQIHTLFAGAMCAAGTLHLNEWGYRALLLKFGICLLSGVWLILNYIDNRGYDYPLIKKKYALLLFITPFAFLETAVQAMFFLNLEPDVITSCCGTLFTSENQGMASTLAALPRGLVASAFWGGLALTLALGLASASQKIKKGYPFAIVSLAASTAAAVAFMSLICLYFYESPLHHCPFCILQKGYGYIGYPIYTTFVAAAIAALGIAVLDPLGRVGSLSAVIPGIRKKLIWVALASHAVFAAIMLYEITFSSFQLD